MKTSLHRTVEKMSPFFEGYLSTTTMSTHNVLHTYYFYPILVSLVVLLPNLTVAPPPTSYLLLNLQAADFHLDNITALIIITNLNVFKRLVGIIFSI